MVSKILSTMLLTLAFAAGQGFQYLYYDATYSVVLMDMIFPFVPLFVLIISSILNLVNVVLIIISAWKLIDEYEDLLCWVYVLISFFALLIIPCLFSFVGIVITVGIMICIVTYEGYVPQIVIATILGGLVAFFWIGGSNKVIPSVSKWKCEHVYDVCKIIEATCEKEGSYAYRCFNCGDMKKETFPEKGHTANGIPTLDAPQVCKDCGKKLAEEVEYLSYCGKELAINQYYGYSDSYITTLIDTQNHDRYEMKDIPYVDKNGASNNLNLSIPLQDFFTHNVISILPIRTNDGKVFNTDSGFKVSFSFSFVDKKVESLYAWGKGLNQSFNSENNDLLKIIGYYTADPAFYNLIYEVVDFSNCYIEVSKKTENGYITVKKIDDDNMWKTIIENGSIEISNDNGALFYDSGTYRVAFKYGITWVTNPASVVYDPDDMDKGVCPFGQVPEQYEYFYVTITEENNNILVPDEIEMGESAFFCQLRAPTTDKVDAFIKNNTVLQFSDEIVFKIGAKIDMTKTGYYYKKWLIDDFSFTIYTYNMITDTYDEYKVYNLMTLVGEQTVYGEEIELILSKEPSLRDKKCKIAFSYTLINESTQEKVVKNQNYYYTIYW